MSDNENKSEIDVIREWIPGCRFHHLDVELSYLSVQGQLDADNILVYGHEEDVEGQRYGILNREDFSLDWGVDLQKRFGVDPSLFLSTEKLIFDKYTGLSFYFESKEHITIIHPKSGKRVKLNFSASEDNLMKSIELVGFIVAEDTISLVSRDHLRILNKERFLDDFFHSINNSSEFCPLDHSGLVRFSRPIPLMNQDERYHYQMTWLDSRIHFFHIDEGIASMSRLITIDTDSHDVGQGFLPLIAFCDMEFLLHQAIETAESRERYAVLLGALEQIREECGTYPVLLLQDRIYFHNGLVAEYDLTKLDVEGMQSRLPERFTDHLLLMSNSPQELRRGVRIFLEHASDTSLQDAYHHIHNLPGAVGVKEIYSLLKSAEVTDDALRNAIRVLAFEADVQGVARRMFSGNQPEKIAGLALINKAFEPVDPFSYILEDEKPPKKLPSPETMPVFQQTLKDFIPTRDETPADKSDLGEFRFEVLKDAIVRVMYWQQNEGFELVRWILQHAENRFALAAIEGIGDGPYKEYLDELPAFLDSPDAELLAAAMNSLRKLESDLYVEKVLEKLPHPKKDVIEAAAKYLEEYGDFSAIYPLMYMLGITHFLRGEEFSILSPAYEVRDAALNVFTREGERLFEDDEWKTPKAGEDEYLRFFAAAAFLVIFMTLFTADDDEGFDDDDRQVLARLGRIVERYSGNSASASWLKPRQFRKMHAQRQEPGTWIDLLSWMQGGSWDEDALFVIAWWIFAFGSVGKWFEDEEAATPLFIYLKQIFTDMAKKQDDFRGTLGSMALVELGLDQAEEARLLEIMQQKDWRGWPILGIMGLGILRYLATDDNRAVFAGLCAQFEDLEQLEEILDQIRENDPQAALAFYEETGMKLEPFNEAVVFAQAGIRRNYEVLLTESIRRGSVEGLRCLGLVGDERAIEVLEEARKMAAPEDVVNEALEQIRTRLKNQEEDRQS